MPNLDVPQVVEAAARAAYDSSQRFNRDSVRAEEWELLPEYWRRIFRAQARAALAVIVPAVTEQIRALHPRHPESCDCIARDGDGVCFIENTCDGCTGMPEWPCPTVRKCDELDAATRGEQP